MAFGIKGPLPSRINNSVTYGAPQDVTTGGGKSVTTGRIMDEVWEDEAINTKPTRDRTGTEDWGDYSFFAQLIKWDTPPGEPDDHAIRLGYYRRGAGKNEWRFAGQTTITSTPTQIKSLLEKTLAKKEWFQLPVAANPPKGEVSETAADKAA